MALDSIRGIAALVVVFYHCSLAVPQLHERIEATYILRPFVAGPAGVYLFFVLSGFVLYGVLAPDSAPTYSNYAAKRLLRLWLPVAAAVLISAFLYIAVGPTSVPGTSGWFAGESWIERPSWTGVAYHFSLFSAERYHQLDNAIWSLAHEIKISLIFPFIVPLVARRPITTLAGATLLSVLSGIVPQPEWLTDTFNPAASLYFLFLFVAGAAIAARREAIAAFASSLPGRELALPALLVSLVLLCSTAGIRASYAVSFGAVLLIALSATSPVIAGRLEQPVLAWLGRVSYSLYLIHLPVLLTLVHLFAGAVPLVILLAIVPAVSLVAAELFCRAVELPSLRFAAWVGSQRHQDRREWRPFARRLRSAD